MTAPRTAAGLALLTDPGYRLDPPDFRNLEAAVLAIEAEATPDRERLAAAIAKHLDDPDAFTHVDLAAALAEGERT